MSGQDAFLEDLGGALVSTDALASLLAEHRAVKDRLERIASFVDDGIADAIGFFVAGNARDDRRHGSGIPAVRDLFKLEGAVRALDAHFWQRAIGLTDCLEVMSQKRRDEWHQQIREMTCPSFEEAVVRDTISALLAARAKHFAERVDGAFQGLSGAHVTNRPEGFWKRMIFASTLDAYGYGNSSKLGLIADLRSVIAKLMRRDEPRYNATAALLPELKAHWGEWVGIDGGALKVRLYKKGTAHLEVHPDMAWRLNTILAGIYPRAIPPQHRQRPKAAPRDAQVIQRPLPFEVLELLACAKGDYERPEYEGGDRKPVRHSLTLGVSALEISRHVREEAHRVLASLGGVRVGGDEARWESWRFDYDPLPVVRRVVVSGCVPDDKTHQFYQSTGDVREEVRRLLGEPQKVPGTDLSQPWQSLEPQAGLGALATLMPDPVTCVELSALRCEVLRARGFREVYQADFLAWSAANIGRFFDRVATNPPFDGGRWRAHVEAAASHVRPGGRMVAVLPQGARLFCPDGFSRTDGGTYAFPGTSIEVTVVSFDRSAA